MGEHHLPREVKHAKTLKPEPGPEPGATIPSWYWPVAWSRFRTWRYDRRRGEYVLGLICAISALGL
jgi:hypothetical protein